MGVAEIEAERHVLYRFYDADGALLYIGITVNPGRRFGRHGSDKPWWSHVANIRMEVHPDRPAVLEAERVAIAAERPRYNIRLTDGAPAPEQAPVDETPGEWPVQVGDVVALGLAGEQCPVGMIRGVTAWGPRIQTMSFMDGTFDQAIRTVPWSDVLEIRHARPKTLDELDSVFEEDYVAGGGTVWHTEPLGEFQTEWMHGRERMLEVRAIQQSWKVGR